MKITDNRNHEIVFGKLDQGDIFEYVGNFYLKTDTPCGSIENDDYDAVRLMDGKHVFFSIQLYGI